MKMWVVLEALIGPDRGYRFWLPNSAEAGKLEDGTEAYKVLLETDSEDEAIQTCREAKCMCW